MGNLDLDTGQVLYAGKVPVGAPAGSGLFSNRACFQPNYRQIVPRFGFAYQALEKLVVRGGYSATSFYEGNSTNQRLTALTPFIQTVNVNSVSPPAASGSTSASGGTPRTVEQGFSAAGPINFSGSYQIYPRNIQPAYVQEWNLTTEYALSPTTSLHVGYIGEEGQHIEDYGNLNQYLVDGDPNVTDANFGNISNQGNISSGGGSAAVRSVERHLQVSARYTF